MKHVSRLWWVPFVAAVASCAPGLLGDQPPGADVPPLGIPGLIPAYELARQPTKQHSNVDTLYLDSRARERPIVHGVERAR